jgi:hypothetical protein
VVLREVSWRSAPAGAVMVASCREGREDREEVLSTVQLVLFVEP